MNWLRSLLRTKRESAKLWKSGRDHYSVILTSEKRYEIDVYDSDVGGKVTHEVVLSTAKSSSNEAPSSSDKSCIRIAFAEHFAGRGEQVFFI